MDRLEGRWCTNRIVGTTGYFTTCNTWVDGGATCPICGGPRQQQEGISRDELFRIINLMVRERNEMGDTLTRTQERLAAYIEVARCAKAVLFLRDEAFTIAMNALADAIAKLEEGVGSAALQTPPTGPASPASTALVRGACQAHGCDQPRKENGLSMFCAEHEAAFVGVTVPYDDGRGKGRRTRT